MVGQVAKVSHGELEERQSSAPVAFDYALDDFALRALPGLQVGVDFAQTGKGLGGRVEVVGVGIVEVSGAEVEEGRAEGCIGVCEPL